MTIMKKVDWHELPRQTRLAHVMFPNLSDAETQRDLAELSRNEGKKSPLQAHMEREHPKQGRKW
jgi:hypothetical protein